MPVLRQTGDRQRYEALRLGRQLPKIPATRARQGSVKPGYMFRVRAHAMVSRKPYGQENGVGDHEILRLLTNSKPDDGNRDERNGWDWTQDIEKGINGKSNHGNPRRQDANKHTQRSTDREANRCPRN